MYQSCRLAIFICFLSQFFYASSVAQRTPNVIFILTDQWRSTAFGYAGNRQVKTPHLDQFSKESVNFKNCVSVLPICTPYRAALMTGRFPTTTGMITNDLYLPEKENCMAEIFKQAGYATAFYGKWHLDGHGRMNNVQPERRQGFDHWKGSECSHDYNNMPYYENDDPTLKYWEGYSPFSMGSDIEKYMAERSKEDNPFLLFISLETPHFSKHIAPKKYMDMYPPATLELPDNADTKKFPKVREELQEYYAHCTATDEAIGKLLEKIKLLGIYEHSIIVFSADHGEMMGSHSVRPREKQVAWDESVKTPFLIRYPGIGDQAGKSTLTPITTPDVLPTMLSLANVSIPADIEGTDLSRVARNPDKQVDRAALFMNVYYNAPSPFYEYRAIKTTQYTYIKSTEKPEGLYDNINDLYQMNNLIDDRSNENLIRKMEKKLKVALKRIGDDDFKSHEFYFKKFGFQINGIKKEQVPYSVVPDQPQTVISPLSH
jgi:arylsulfatase A-like enzyme